MKCDECLDTVLSDNADCQECVNKLLEYEDGLLSDHDASKLKKHLEECSRCRQYQHSLDGVWTNLDKAFPQELEPAADFKLRFWKRVGQEADKDKIINLETALKLKNKRLNYWKTFTAAASFVIVGGVMLWNVFASNGASDNMSGSLSASVEVGRSSTVSRTVAKNTGTNSELSGDVPYYTDYVLADEFDNNANEDLSRSVIYADYEPDYIMSQELLDKAFDEAADSAY